MDALFLGPDDLSLRAGLPMDEPRPEGFLDDAIRNVAEAAASHGKIAGGVFATPETFQPAVELGYRLIVAAADTSLLMTGSQQRSQSLRQCGP